MGKPYRICPDCGAALDPGEICDCQQEPRYMSVADVAVRWAVSTDLVYSLIRNGSLQAMRLGSTIRIPVEAVEAKEDECKSSAEPRRTLKRQGRKPVLRL